MPEFILSAKLGLGYNSQFQLFSGGAPAESFLTIPHHLTANLGKEHGKHFFEIGLGGTALAALRSHPYLFYPIVGYRILPLEKDKINFRVYGQIPFTGLETGEILFIPFGLSVGVSL